MNFSKRGKIELLDSTLREGMQSQGISFSVEDKLAIVKALDRIGIDIIEAGNPSTGAKELEFFRRAKSIKLTHSVLAAFGSTRRKNTTPPDDAGLDALIKAETPVVVIFGKCSESQITDVLKTTVEENEAMIKSSISYLRLWEKRVIFDAEHFFDGYRSNPKLAISAIKAAVGAGAEKVVLCDTNGGTFPDEIAYVTSEIVKIIDAPIGIHCHDDCGLAVAGTISAVKAGAVHAQGTFLGFGERTGNARLSAVIPALQLKQGYSLIPPEKMPLLTSAAHEIAEISNVRIDSKEPFVGHSAFAHKAGMHLDGVSKNSGSFEHIDPSEVGNKREFLISEISGKTAVKNELAAFFPDIKKDSPLLLRMLEKVKKLEHEGYHLEGAKASFLLYALKENGSFKKCFELVGYDISSSMDESTAKISIKVFDKTEESFASGNGPVNALDKALRKALEAFYPTLSGVQLIDYKVRVIDSGAATGAKVRVLISSSNGKEVWTTVGVSSDIIKASLEALIDSIEYILQKEML